MKAEQEAVLEQPVGSRGTWAVFATLAFCYLLVMFQRFAPAAISEQLATELATSNVALGTLGAAYFYPYALMQIPCGALADIVGPKLILVISLVLQGIGSFWFATTQSLSQAFFARLLIGFGCAFVYVSVLKALSQLFPRRQFPIYVGVLQAVGNAGAVFAATPLVFVVSLLSWRGAFVAIGILTLAVALLLPWLLKQTTGTSTAKPEPKAGRSANLKGLLRSPLLLAMALWMFAYAGTKLSFQSLWAGRYFTEVGGLGSERIGLLLLLLGLGGVLGSPLYGWLARRAGSSKQTMLVGTFLVTGFWAYLSLAGGPVTGSLFYVMLGVIAGVFTLSFSWLQEKFPAGVYGTAAGIVNGSAFVGSALFTQFTGFVVDRGLVSSGGDWQVAFHGVFFLSAGMMLVASIVLLVVSRTQTRLEQQLQ